MPDGFNGTNQRISGSFSGLTAVPFSLFYRGCPNFINASQIGVSYTKASAVDSTYLLYHASTGKMQWRLANLASIRIRALEQDSRRAGAGATGTAGSGAPPGRRTEIRPNAGASSQVATTRVAGSRHEPTAALSCIAWKKNSTCGAGTCPT